MSLQVQAAPHLNPAQVPRGNVFAPVRTWLKRARLCSQAFRESCQEFYQAELEELPFAEDTEASRRHINDWVAEKTEGEARALRRTWGVAGRSPDRRPAGVGRISRPARPFAYISRVREVTEW